MMIMMMVIMGGHYKIMAQNKSNYSYISVGRTGIAQL